MTEEEWTCCSNTYLMLHRLCQPGMSVRKLHLLICSCCRRIWRLFQDERCRMAIEVAERAADGSASEDELYAAGNATYEAMMESLTIWPGPQPRLWHHHRGWCLMGPDSDNPDCYADAFVADAAAGAACAAIAFPPRWGFDLALDPILDAVADGIDKWDDSAAREAAVAAEMKAQCELVRDIIGNPFRPVILDPAWLTPDVVTLAGHIYHDRAFDLMLDLADALEDAGCQDAEILDHCRGPGPHAKGCWVVDLLTGRS